MLNIALHSQLRFGGQQAPAFQCFKNGCKFSFRNGISNLTGSLWHDHLICSLPWCGFVEEDRLIRNFAKLVENEKVCLRLVNEGMGSKEIARRLNISHHTVDARLKSACAKIGTKSRFVAAKLLFDQELENAEVTVTSADPKLVYENYSLSRSPPSSNNGASAEEGNGSGDLGQQRPTSVKSSDFASGQSQPAANHPYAVFFGGENKLSIGRRLFYIAGIAIGLALAYGGVANGLGEISRLLSTPEVRRP